MRSNIISVSAFGISAAVAQGATGQLGDALVVTNNPVGRSAVATLPEQPYFTAGSPDGNVQGYVRARSGANGAGVDFEVSLSNFPTEGGPFLYHVHDQPVPADGNCTATLAHLDPFIRGEQPPCDSGAPQTCQVGDLAGKAGKVTSDPFTVNFHDDYSSLAEGPGSYFANRSIVIHFSNTTRITCANFAVMNSNGTNIPTPTGGYPTSTPTVTTVPTAAANALGVAKNFAMMPLMALILAFF